MESAPAIPASAQAGPSPDESAKKAAEEQLRREILASLLDTAARERLARIALVSRERAREIEEIILRGARSGQIRGQVTESQLISLLEQTTEQAPKASILYQRRKDPDDNLDF